jgi:peptidoglycan/LPS O-acetylase OafA/YrhL
LSKPGIAAQKLRSLEMLRGVAAILVVLYHTRTILGTRGNPVPFAHIFGAGYRGVDLFFVLSGFIIAHVHIHDIGRPARLRDYAFNRVARIYPAIIIMTILAALLYTLGFGSPSGASKLSVSGFTASLLLLPQAGDPLVNVSWSLKYEIFFYVAFATLILNVRLGLVLLLAWQIAVLTVGVCLPPQALGLAGFYLRSLCLDFGIGLVCAWLAGRRVIVLMAQASHAPWVLLAAGIAGFAIGMAVDPVTALAGIPCGLGAGAIILALTVLEQAGRIRVADVLVRLGGASYGIYLVHFSVITVLVTVLLRVHGTGMDGFLFLACAVFGIAAGIVFDQAVDQPVQRLLRQRLKPLLFGRLTATVADSRRVRHGTAAARAAAARPD